MKKGLWSDRRDKNIVVYLSYDDEQSMLYTILTSRVNMTDTHSQCLFNVGYESKYLLVQGWGLLALHEFPCF